MFNRCREFQALRTTLKDVPQWSVISGPVNSGKSTLLLEVINNLKREKPKPSIIHLDLRARTFRDVNSFASEMLNVLSSWFNDLWESFSTMGASLSVSKVEIELILTKEEEPTKRLRKLFDTLSKSLPDWNWLRGYNIPPPILFIDEANRLRTLLDDRKGDTVLNDFFEWIVHNTKQMHQFHVIMASSDSFFHRWIAQYIDSAYFRNFVIGHLCKEEARRYWEEEVVKDGKPLAFEDVYNICGGCMHLMGETYRIYNATGGVVKPYGMSYISQRRSKFIKALNAASIHWTRNDIIEVMEKLIQSKYGYVSYDSLCETVCQQTVDSLIEQNIIHLRPCGIFPFDVEMAVLRNIRSSLPICLATRATEKSEALK